MLFQCSSRRHPAIVSVVAAFLCTQFLYSAEPKKTQPIKVRPIDMEQARKVSYTSQIKPLLVNYCVECHSANERKGDFEATSLLTLIMPGKKAGPGVVPGRPDESSIVQYIRGQKEPQMPKGNPPLSEDELHLIRLWIAAGAQDDTSQMLVKAAASGAVTNSVFARSAESLLIERRRERLASIPPAPPAPKIPGPAFNEIDRFILAQWQAAGLPEAKNPPPVCDDVTFLRRAYLDLIGAVPRRVEAHRYLFGVPLEQRRTLIVDELLARKRDYADHWMPFWEEALASANANVQGGILTRGNYRFWLSNSFYDNKPYDVLVAELLDPLMPGYKQASEQDVLGEKFSVSYVRNSTHTDTIQTAANVAQVFLGTSMKCASCHSHFENREWPQARFLAFAGYFAEKDLELIRCEQKTGQTIPARFPFEIPGSSLEAPAKLDDRLHQLTLLLTDPANPRFAKALVNRLWKRFFGLGLVEPVDDFRQERQGSNPALLEWLADDFMRHGYDIMHTIKLIVSSRTYQLQFDPNLADRFDSAHPDAPRYFRSPQLRRMTAEQIIDSAEVILTQKLIPVRRAYTDNVSTPLTRALGRPSTRNEISTARSEELAVVQALEMLNGPDFHELVYSGRLLDELANDPRPDVQVEGLYTTALQRAPTPAEVELANKYLSTRLASPSKTPATPVEEVLMDDELPLRSKAEGSSGTNSLRWVRAPDFPVFSGDAAHTYGGTNAARQQAIIFQKPIKIRHADVFFTHVYLDPRHPPTRIMVQWRQNQTFFQAYWSKDAIQGNLDIETVRFHRGPLPPPGSWVRLEIPMQSVGVDTGELDGWSYDVTGGNAYWDKTGVVRMPRSPLVEPLGDLLWSLFVSPEFQYIR